jgi:hypothetical protein
MTDEPAHPDRRIVTEPDRIRRLAEVHDAVPVASGGDLSLRTGVDTYEGERLAWADFFDRFRESERIVHYRPDEADERSAEPLEVVGPDDRPVDARSGRSTAAGPDGPGAAGAEGTDADPPAVTEQGMARSDTGDVEPVAPETTERDSDEDHVEGEVSTAGIGDSARGPPSPAGNLVLDEIHEHETGFGGADLNDEYLVFVNDGDDPVDVSGWTVENEAGISYTFPESTVVGPGTQLRLYTGEGSDTESRRYWGADVPIWGEDGDTVTVSTAHGERVIRMPFEA